MKFLAALVISFALALATSDADISAEKQEAAEPAAQEEATAPEADAFVLETLDDDTPETAQLKAALRLLSGYTITIAQVRACGLTYNADEAAKVLGNYNSRNGNTMNQVMVAIKQKGGITEDIRAALDKKAALFTAPEAEATDCKALLADVASGTRDIYKGPEYIDDYKLMRGQKK